MGIFVSQTIGPGLQEVNNIWNSFLMNYKVDKELWTFKKCTLHYDTYIQLTIFCPNQDTSESERGYLYLLHLDNKASLSSFVA